MTGGGYAVRLKAGRRAAVTGVSCALAGRLRRHRPSPERGGGTDRRSVGGADSAAPTRPRTEVRVHPPPLRVGGMGDRYRFLQTYEPLYCGPVAGLALALPSAPR